MMSPCEDPTIGASEAAPALGLSPYQTPLQWQLRRRGLVDIDEETDAQYLGKMLEPSIRESFADQHDVEVRFGDDLCTVFDNTTKRKTGVSVSDPVNAFLRASPDGVILPGDMPDAFADRFQIDRIGGEHVMIECKTAGIAGDTPRGKLRQDWGAPGSDVVPLQYSTQCHTGAMVVDNALRAQGLGFCSKTILRVLGPGMPFVDHVIDSNAHVRQWLVRRLSAIVQANLIGDEVLPAESLDDYAALERMMSKPGDGNKKLRPADFGDDVSISVWLEARAQKDAAKLREAEARLSLVGLIGEGYGIDCDAGRLVYTFAAGDRPREMPARIVEEIKSIMPSMPSSTSAVIAEIIRKHTKIAHTSRTLRFTPRKP